MKAAILCLFLLNATIAYCHSDFIFRNKIENVTAEITTGFHYEEISKTFMLGYYASRIAQRYGYTKDIFIKYRHAYTKKIDPAYFLSFDLGEYTATGGGLIHRKSGGWDTARTSGKLLEKEGLVINIISESLKFDDVLSLVIYGINNEKSIQRSQRKISQDADWSYWKHSFNSIDTSKVRQIISKGSKEISTVLSEPCNQFYLHQDKWTQHRQKEGFSYFFKDDHFYLRASKFNKSDIVLLTLPNIVFLTPLNYESAIIFDSDSSFYYADLRLSTGGKPMVSARQVIQKRNQRYYPAKLFKVSRDKVFMTFQETVKDPDFGRVELDRTMLFNPLTQVLIQNVDTVLSAAKQGAKNNGKGDTINTRQVETDLDKKFDLKLETPEELTQYFTSYALKNLVNPGDTRNKVFLRFKTRLQDELPEARKRLSSLLNAKMSAGQRILRQLQLNDSSELDQCTFVPLVLYYLTPNVVKYKNGQNVREYYTLDTASLNYCIIKNGKLIAVMNHHQKSWRILDTNEKNAQEYAEVSALGKQLFAFNNSISLRPDTRHIIHNFGYMLQDRLMFVSSEVKKYPYLANEDAVGYYVRNELRIEPAEAFFADESYPPARLSQTIKSLYKKGNRY